MLLFSLVNFCTKSPHATFFRNSSTAVYCPRNGFTPAGTQIQIPFRDFVAECVCVFVCMKESAKFSFPQFRANQRNVCCICTTKQTDNAVDIVTSRQELYRRFAKKCTAGKLCSFWMTFETNTKLSVFFGKMLDWATVQRCTILVEILAIFC